MTNPKTVQDIRAHLDVSQRDLDRMACRLFNNTNEMSDVIEGYVVSMPDFVTLPDACKQFIRKALVFATVTNILDTVETIDASALMPVGVEDPPMSEETRKSIEREITSDPHGPEEDNGDPWAGKGEEPG